ncbi:GntR family transcriptional regulator [Dermacoccaceae bacterium W4C1]
MSGPSLVLDLDAPEPVFEQIRRQLAAQIRAGVLSDGDRLPSISVLAADLGIAGNTVARAYKELAAAGLVQRRRRTGTVVTAPSGSPMPEQLSAAADAFVAAAHESGVPETEALDLVRARWLAL